MEPIKIPSPKLTENLEHENNQNADSSFGTQITRAKRFSSSETEPQHQSLYQSKTKVFAEIGNRTMLDSNLSKLPAKTTKLNQLHVGQQYLRKTGQQNTENSKECLKVLVNHAEQGQENLKNQERIIKKGLNSPKNVKQMKEKPKLKPLKDLQTSQKQETQNVFEHKHMEDSALNFDKHKSHSLELTKFDLIATPSIFQECSHVMKPIKRNYEIQHIFNRHNSCAFSEPVTFNLPTKSQEFISSQKVSRFMCSEFKIFLSKKGQQHELGTLKSNFVGSIYNFYPKNSDAIYFSLLFKDHKRNIQSCLKYCEVFINKSLVNGQESHQKIPYEEMKSLQELYLVNYGVQAKCKKNQIIKLQSEIPVWSSTKNCFCLKFPKNALPSAKNTVMVDEDGKQALKFFKDSELTYNLTFENPLSWVAAYGFALVMTDFKLFTE